MFAGLYPHSFLRKAHHPKSGKTRLSVVHNVLMVGLPGAGKTLLARTIPSILPRMTIDEALGVTRIDTVADQLPPRAQAGPRHRRPGRH